MLAAALLAAIPFACDREKLTTTTQAASPRIELTSADNGRTIEAKIGQTVTISLGEGDSIPYRWSMETLDGQSVEQVGSVERVYRPAPEPAKPGTGGSDVIFTFKAVRAGKSVVKLGYYRFRSDEPDHEFTITLDVRGTLATRSGSQSAGDTATQPTSPRIELTIADNDRSVELKIGQTVKISLGEVGSIPYRWSIATLDGQSVEQVGSAERVHRPAPESAKPGTGGSDVIFTFKAVRPGKTVIKVGYYYIRSNKPDHEFTVTLDVRGALATQSGSQSTADPASNPAK
jgi:predicted secreted protein